MTTQRYAQHAAAAERSTSHPAAAAELWSTHFLMKPEWNRRNGEELIKIFRKDEQEVNKAK